MIEIEITCRARGVTSVHVQIADTADKYIPVNFFVLAVCPG